jgi:8-oxo-dGTP pyrophosphatase MutT (NUDIX family)
MRVVRQAGAVVFRIEGGVARVLIIRSKKDPSLWVFPKGHIDPGEAATMTALREAYEEAGVSGLLIGPAGPPLTFRAGDQMMAVDYFLVELTAEMASPEGREKAWLLPEEAEERLAFDNARQLLRTAAEKLRERALQRS